VQHVALDKKNLQLFVTAMLRQGRVRGPVLDSQTGDTVLADLTPGSGLVLDYSNFKLPPKREFFPQSEAIGRFGAAGLTPEPLVEEKIIYFGLRPCDAKSLRYLDKVFIDAQFTDPYYRARRNDALIIALACDSVAETCFCSSVKGGPASADGADVVAFNLDEALVFEPVTGQGEEFLNKNAAILREPTAAELQKKNEQAQLLTAPTGIKAEGVPAELQKNFTSPLWDAVTETCLGCGVCTWLCPTCHCFDLYDEPDAGRKMRVHDSCMFASFTREASGHNPRAKRGERMRQRVMHKFLYAPDNYGDTFCVGCGRCVAYCPTNIDIRETVAKAAL
jgi:ferredoxin